MPEELGQLIHLTYLNLSYNILEQVPDTMAGLTRLRCLGMLYRWERFVQVLMFKT